MNETQLRNLLADRAGSAAGSPSRYEEVRHRIRARKRARIAGLTAAILATLVATVVIGPFARDRGDLDVARAALGWPPRGLMRAEPDLLPVVVRKWGGPPDDVRLLAVQPTPYPPGRVVIFEARERDGKPVVVFVHVSSDTKTVEVVGTTPVRARTRQLSILFLGEGDVGVLIGVAAPDIDGIEVDGFAPSSYATFYGLSAPAWTTTTCGTVRIRLKQGAAVIATEKPTVTRRLPPANVSRVFWPQLPNFPPPPKGCPGG